MQQPTLALAVVVMLVGQAAPAAAMLAVRLPKELHVQHCVWLE